MLAHPIFFCFQFWWNEPSSQITQGTQHPKNPVVLSGHFPHRNGWHQTCQGLKKKIGEINWKSIGQMCGPLQGQHFCDSSPCSVRPFETLIVGQHMPLGLLDVNCVFWRDNDSPWFPLNFSLEIQMLFCDQCWDSLILRFQESLKASP